MLFDDVSIRRLERPIDAEPLTFYIIQNTEVGLRLWSLRDGRKR